MKDNKKWAIAALRYLALNPYTQEDIRGAGFSQFDIDNIKESTGLRVPNGWRKKGPMGRIPLTELISDATGNDWYFDDNVLVEGDKSILEIPTTNYQLRGKIKTCLWRLVLLKKLPESIFK